MNFHYKQSSDFEGPMQTTWSISSLDAAKQCLRRYYYQKVLGLRDLGSSLPLDFGTAIHSALQSFHVTPGYFHERLRAAIRAGIASFADHVHSDNRDRNLQSLIRSIIAACDRHANTTLLQTPDGPAVEYIARVPLALDLYLYVRFDAIMHSTGLLYPVDYKTTTWSLTKNYWLQYNRSSQVTGYLLAAKMSNLPKTVGGLLIEAIHVNGNQTNIESRVFQRTPSYLESWRENALRKIDEVHEIACNEDLEDVNSWPENDTACRWCPFIHICSAHDAMKQEVIETQYTVRRDDIPTLPKEQPNGNAE